MRPTRRILFAAPLLLAPPARAADARIAMAALRALEQRSGARIGVAAMDSANGNGVFYREAERFTMCSTFKLSLAAAILARADAGQERTDRQVTYAKPVLDYSPVTGRNWQRGMTVEALCEAAIVQSDNTAANLLLDALGGPAALTAFWRRLGDRVSRLDDREPALNVPDGDRNTTTPSAMLADLKDMLLGDVLSAPSRARLLDWMAKSQTGAAKLKAGLPAGWHVADKTGSGPDGTGLTHDIGLVTPPGRKPILVTVYVAQGSDAVVADTGRILAAALA